MRYTVYGYSWYRPYRPAERRRPFPPSLHAYATQFYSRRTALLTHGIPVPCYIHIARNLPRSRTITLYYYYCCRIIIYSARPWSLDDVRPQTSRAIVYFPARDNSAPVALCIYTTHVSRFPLLYLFLYCIL